MAMVHSGAEISYSMLEKKSKNKVSYTVYGSFTNAELLLLNSIATIVPCPYIQNTY